MGKYAKSLEDQPHLHMVPGVEFYGERLQVYATERQAAKIGEALRQLLRAQWPGEMPAVLRVGRREEEQSTPSFVTREELAEVVFTLYDHTEVRHGTQGAGLAEHRLTDMLFRLRKGRDARGEADQ